ncbi:MAG TPA: RpiB/LacA/LacB family sugar-phosphate isomerase [Solirubrobacteraceae bacterium]|jgi:ribose 5-phosphate isomerase B
MRVACAFDHAGVPFRERVLAEIRDAGHEPIDLGEADDYPDSALAAGRAISNGEAERGIVVCGSGAGVAVAACKIPGIRAALAHETYTGAQCVSHDDCNVICMGARVIGPEIAAGVVRAFLAADFSGEERHVRRLNKVKAIERDGLDTDLEAIT